ncbi:penicillin-binding protein 2 [Myxococcota bacterium]|nr:penicillin-binding protein 2 [Myxococcota bacterium]
MRSHELTSEEDRQTAHHPRRAAFLMALITVVAFSVILWRLWDVQIRQGAEFIEKSKGNFVQFNRIEHARGEILDRDGRTLVTNRPSVKVEVTPAFFPKTSRFVTRLGRIAGLSKKESDSVLQALLKSADEGGPPILLARDLTADEVRALQAEQRALELPVSSVVTIAVPPPSAPDLYAAYLDPEHFPTAGRVVRRLADDMVLTPGELDALKKRITRATGLDVYLPIIVRRDVSVDVEERVARDVLLGDLPGVAVRTSKSRHYELGPMAAHLLGYVNELSPKELESRREDGYRIGDVVGRRGVEKAFEQSLRGVDGKEAVVVDSKGRLQESRFAAQLQEELGEDEAPRAGDRVYLTIDKDLQIAAEKAFPGRAGATVVLEVNTGRILAITSTPTFDPNLVTGFFDPREKKRLDENKQLRPWRFRAIQDHFAPGSTFKVFTAIAALNKRVSTPTETTTCHGAYMLGATRFRCWKDSGHGPVNVVTSLEKSCDVYYYTMGARLGLDAIAEVAFELGLGARTGIPLDGESPGIVPTAAWYKKNLPEGYTLGAAVNASVGQGATTATPIQLAVAYAALANGGTVFEPQIGLKIESVDDGSITEIPPKVRRQVKIPEPILGLIREGLRRVVNDPGGTAFKRRLEQIEVSGKTGTAQVAKLVKRGHGEDIPWHLRDHAWFASYAPASSPEIVVVVLNEHGGGGSSAAAPAAMEIIAAWHAKRQRQARVDVATPIEIAVLADDTHDAALPIVPHLEDHAWHGE